MVNKNEDESNVIELLENMRTNPVDDKKTKNSVQDVKLNLNLKQFSFITKAVELQVKESISEILQKQIEQNEKLVAFIGKNKDQVY